MSTTGFITTQLADKTKVVVEVTRLTSSTDTEVSAAIPSLEPIWNTVSSIASSIGERLAKVEAKKAIVEFGVEFAAEGGGLTALLVKGTGKANLKITLEWS